MLKPASRQSGFTIIELMVATAVFSVVLLIVMAGVISFSRQYYKGIISSNTQSVTRQIVTDIAQNMQLGSGTISTIAANASTQGFCLNNKPYYYIIGKQLLSASDSSSDATRAQHVLVTTDDPTCPSRNIDTANLSSIGPNARELLGKHMRLTNFAVTHNPAQPIQVTVRVAYGDYDLLCSTANNCAAPVPLAGAYPSPADDKIICHLGISGSQFCSVSGLSTTIENRVQ